MWHLLTPTPDVKQTLCEYRESNAERNWNAGYGDSDLEDELPDDGPDSEDSDSDGSGPYEDLERPIPKPEAQTLIANGTADAEPTLAAMQIEQEPCEELADAAELPSEFV